MSVSEGILEVNVIPTRQMHYNEKTNYGIYSCKTLDEIELAIHPTYQTFSVKGDMFRLDLRQSYLMNLVEREDKKWGNYYEVISIYEDIPDDRNAQYKFLRAILTQKQVDNLYATYPEGNIIEMIQNDQIDYNKVNGLGAKSYEKIKKRVDGNITFQEAYRFFENITSVTQTQIIKMVKHFKSSKLLIQNFKSNPYCIINVSGIGFATADKIALEYGYPHNGEHRIKAAIRFIVEMETQEGHTYSNRHSIVGQVQELVKEDEDIIDNYVNDCEEIVIVDEVSLALKKYYQAEKYLARQFKRLKNKPSTLNINVDSYIEEEEKLKGIKFTDKQKEILHNVTKYSINVLGGYSGSGKSSTVSILLDMLSEAGITYKLVSPTGKAAKVLRTYTGRDAETIHRAAGIGLSKDASADKQVDEEFVIIDESSMVDVALCAKLLSKCVHKDLKLLFIGDPAQIASIGAGQLLYDLLESNVIPNVVLDKVFRQSEGGAYDVITKIRENQKFVKHTEGQQGIKKFGDDCQVVLVNQDNIIKGSIHYYKDMLTKYSPEDICIVTSMNKGKYGTIAINKLIQELVNPKSNDKNELIYKVSGELFFRFREGDIVLNTVNGLMLTTDDRNVMIVNGDTGKIVSVDVAEKELIVDFGNGQLIIYTYKKLHQLQHAWCMTTFKMQGSSAKGVIVIADKAHKRMLNRGLLYTAASRVTDELVLVGQADTINYAMNKDDTKLRRTFLKGMLRGEV